MLGPWDGALGLCGVFGRDGACGASVRAVGAEGVLGAGDCGRIGVSVRGACGAPAEGAFGLLPIDGACGVPAEGIPPDGVPADGRWLGGIDGAEGAVGRAGASAREADVDMSGERGAGALEPRSPRLPGVPVQPWPPVVGRPAAGDDGALPAAFGAPPAAGAAWVGVDDGELSGVRVGAWGASGRLGASTGGATEDWTVEPVLRAGAGVSGVDDVCGTLGPVGDEDGEEDGDELSGVRVDDGELSGVRDGVSGDELSGVRDGASGVDELSGVRDGDGEDDGDELSGVREGEGEGASGVEEGEEGEEEDGDDGEEDDGDELSGVDDGELSGEDGEESGEDDEESGVDEELSGDDVEPGLPEGERSGESVRWMKPPGLMDFVEITSRPVTLPTSLPTTFMILVKISTSLPSSGETFLMVLMSFWISSPIRVAHFEIAVTACATMTGVPKPSVNTASSTHVISFATRSAIRSRTISRTKPTTMPITPTTVPTEPAVDAAPDNASSCSPAAAR